jgi:hypothetical protein
MTLEDIDAELALLPATPVTDADLDARATLMARRIELDQATRATAAENSRPKLRGNLVISIPDGLALTNFYGERGRVCQVRMTEDGHKVLDLFVGEFKNLLMGADGLLFQNCNPDAMSHLAAPNA